ncbi:Mediator of RNA polymerase II transcription subunit 13 [Cytospora mali]|uniref:Mediator of RNA polymerase II transcription subunit 13 n=1 Tax=Cytospora mali TaxID=578113 RepID=A0A194W079_CYTMA|nr:Mediator of RNA polymerase II transcription subunit 13 [Valsa mali]
MDPGEYETNILLIDNVSSVAFKIYEPVVSNSATYTFSASDVEYTLRNRGNLVYADPLRRVIWCFSLTANDGSSIGQPGETILGANLDVCGYKLGLVEEGGLEPISLLKNRILAPNSLITPNSSSPSGSALDTAMRAAPTPGGIMNPAGFSLEGDAKTSFGPSVDSKGYGSIPAKDIHEYFIAAILASLSYRFCTKTGAIPLDSKTFILPSNTADSETSLPVSAPMVASLRVHLTTTGSLLIGMSLSIAQGLQTNSEGLSLSLPQNGATVLAAPFGVFGTCQLLADGDQTPVDGSTVESPDTQFRRFRPDMDGRSGQWRSTCYKLLEMRGISSAILSRSSWLNIQYLRRKPTESRSDGKRTPLISSQTHMMWPAVLCFRKRTRSPLTLNYTVDPSGISFRDGFDALDHARAWYISNGEREELLARRKHEREATGPKDTGEMDPRLLQQNSASSPLAMRRASNTGAAGGAMYPTPPDGVQNPAGVTFSIDGTTSSSESQVPSAALVDIDTTISAPGGLGDAFDDEWDGTESKRDQSLIQGDDWELNNDVFVDNDITDADFNFFDEQPGAMDVSMPDLSEMATVPKLEPPNQSTLSEPQRPPDTTALKVGNSPAPPVFAKPALKHARSSLGESRQRNNVKISPSNGIKRQPSPFDPAAVYKRLKASVGSGFQSNSNTITLPTRRGRVFDKLDFDSSLTVVNKKYEQSGRFDFHWDNEDETAPRQSKTLPTTDYLRRHGKSRKTLKELRSSLGAQITRFTGGVESHNIEIDPAKDGDSTSDADEVSLVSDQDDASDFSDEPSSPTKLGVRRRRLGDDNESLAPSLRDVEMMDESQAYSGVDLSKLFINDPSEMPIPRYFADSEPVSQRLAYGDDDFIMIAQILTEQAVSGSLKITTPDFTAAHLDVLSTQRDIVYGTRNSLQTLQTILPPCLQSASGCQLRQLLEVQDVPLLATPNRMQPRPPGGPEQRPSLVQIPPPHLDLRRHETRLSVLPSAAKFWESLGLGPSQGPKDVQSVCVFPNLDGMADNAGIFMDRLRSVYESLKLGNFERMSSSANTQNGLVPFAVDKTNNSPIASQGSRFGSPLIEDMAKLAVTIFNSTAVSTNFVIYFVYTPDNPNTIVESCAAFQRLFEIYKRALAERKKPAQNELVLQLVSLADITTSTSMVVLSPHNYARICLETYDRCTLFGGPMPSPAIVLEQPMTRGIDFHLRNPPSAHILHENSCMHIAYSQSVDERWITAAWSDNRGCKQMTASYCLGRKGKPLSRSFTEIAREIWMTTYDLTSIWKVHWRIIITKNGPMDQQEVSDWVSLAQTESSVTLVLLTVDTNPSLRLIPSMPKVPMTAQTAFYSTPVSTPQSSMVSPEQIGNPPTPKGAPTSAQNAMTPGADNNTAEAESDASLVDVTDTTWAAIASHRLNVSYSLVDPNPAMVSGYLIKRGGSRPEDPPAVMEVNVIHAEGNPRVHEILLREMLTYFRGLGTIARARSVTDEEGDVRPWHVAAAEKGLQALYQLM